MTDYSRFRRTAGFTIVEVMIVLAIAGIILLIVFLAVPAVQRSSRNYDRKNYLGIIDAQMEAFYAENLHYPGALGGNPASPANQTEICNFLHSLPRVDTASGCTQSSATNAGINGTFAENCVNIMAGSYTVCYQNWEVVSHAYIGPVDEMSIMLAHWCNTDGHTDPSQPATYPIAGNDTDTRRFVIWTLLENVNNPLCVDNFPSH